MSEIMPPAAVPALPQDNPAAVPCKLPGPGPWIGGIDCSPEAQALRLRRLGELESIFYAGAASMSDRNRQVTFASRKELVAAMIALRDQLAVCMGCPRPIPRSRVFFLPQEKGL